MAVFSRCFWKVTWIGVALAAFAAEAWAAETRLAAGVDLIREEYLLKSRLTKEEVTLNFFPAVRLDADQRWNRRLGSGIAFQIGRISIDDVNGTSVPETDALYLSMDIEALRYRWSADWLSRGSSIEASAGYLLVRLDVNDDTPPVVLTSNTYQAPMAGLRLDLPLTPPVGESEMFSDEEREKPESAPSRWNFELAFQALPFLSLTESPEESGSSTSGWGVQAGGGLSYRIRDSLTAAIDYRYRHFRISPEGTCRRVGVPGCGSGNEVTEITDAFHIVSFVMGYRFF